MPHMKALTAQVFAGKRIVTGDQFDATDSEAKLLVALGRAKVAEAKKPVGRPRKATQSGDLENSGNVTVHLSDIPVSDIPDIRTDVVTRTRRTYNRRDLTADQGESE